MSSANRHKIGLSTRATSKASGNNKDGDLTFYVYTQKVSGGRARLICCTFLMLIGRLGDENCARDHVIAFLNDNKNKNAKKLSVDANATHSYLAMQSPKNKKKEIATLH